MLTRQSLTLGRPTWLKDPGTESVDGGHQIDWANVDSSYIDAATGKKIIPSGTAMGTLLGTGKMSPRVDTTNPAVGLLIGDAIEDDLVHSISGYGLCISATVYENLLPDSSGGPPATLAGAIKTELQANCPKGFHFITYQDTR